MNKIIQWLADDFAPKVNKVMAKPWIAGVASSMQKILPFIFTGSLIFVYNVAKTYLDFLPDLGMVSNFSFGMLGLIISYTMVDQIMNKLELPGYTLTGGLTAIAVFLIFINPTIDGDAITFSFMRFGPTGILVGMIAGLFTAIIFNLIAKLNILTDSMNVPDFVAEWIRNIIPIFITLLIATIIVFNLRIDLFEVILSVFAPLQNFGQTLPGMILLCFIPAFMFTLGISGWLFAAVSTPIFMAGISANIEAVAAGLPPMNIVTNEAIFTAGLVTMGGVGATLALNILMFRAKSKKLRTLAKVFIVPSIFNINEPIVFGTPVVFNPLLMIPMWINAIVGPIVVYTVMRLGFLNIPSKMIWVGQIPAPFSSVMITEDFRAVFVYIGLLIMYLLIWSPFFKVYDKQCFEEESKVD